MAVMARQTAFKGRPTEMALLDELWEAPEATLLILYGRRRVGKTRLLTHWLRQHAERAIYWVAEPTSALDQLRSFSQALFNFGRPGAPVPIDFTYSTWEQAFRQVAGWPRSSASPCSSTRSPTSSTSTPHRRHPAEGVGPLVEQSNLMLVLSGSQMGLMQKQLLSYQAPLYGRATASWSCRRCPTASPASSSPTISAAERVTIYAIWGGVPAYWERLDESQSVLENVRISC